MPYGTQNQSGAIFGQSMANLGAAIERFGEKKKEREDELKRILSASKAAESFVGALNADERGALGLPDLAEFRMNTPQDKVAMFTGAHQAVGAKRAVADIGKALEEQRNAGRFPAFSAEMGQYTSEPGQIAPTREAYDRFLLPEGQTQPGPRELFQALSRSRFTPEDGGARLASVLEAAQKSNMMGPDILKQLGMVPTGGQVNPNGSAGLTFGLPPPASGPVPPGLSPRTSTVNAQGQVSTTYGTPDSTDAHKTLLSNATEMAHQLQTFEDTVKKFGNFEYMSPEGSAVLGQLPYETAILYSKLVDPATAAREGEVSAAKKYIIPTGLMTRNATTLAAVENQKKELGRRIASTYEQTGQFPPNLSDAFVNKYLPKLASAYKKAQSAAEPAARAGAAAPVDGRVMVIKDGDKFWLPAAQLDEALRSGYQRVP